MSKVELHVLKSHIDPVLTWLGNRGSFQLARAAGRRDADSSARKTFRLLQECRTYLEVADLEALPPDTRVPDPAMEVESLRIAAVISAQRERRDNILGRLAECERALVEARSLSGLALPWADLARTSFLTWRIGRLSSEGRAAAEQKLRDSVVFLSLEDPRLVVVLTSRKGGIALDDELAPFGFHSVDLPADQTGIPEEVVMGLGSEQVKLTQEKDLIEQERAQWALTRGPRLLELLASWAVAIQIEEVREASSVSEHVCFLQGWMPSAEVPALEELERLAEGRIGVRIYDPYELETVRTGREIVPVRLRHGRLVQGFERLVLSYGTPLYGTIDPTPLVAASFILLFALMFGDMGQGLVLFLVGGILGRGRFRSLLRWKDFAPIFVSIGAASMVTGFLYGSVFSNETLLVPVSRWLTGLYGVPQDQVVGLLPTHGYGRLLAFFGFTLALGVVLNSIGLVINIVNKFRLGQTSEAWFSRTGVSGAVFLWYSVWFTVRILQGGVLQTWDLAGFFIPLAARVLGPLFVPRSEDPAGLGTLFLGSLLEILETLTYWFSNTLSFLRVGAFALAHAVLSLIVFTMADLVGGSSTLGPLFSALIFVIGNLLILVLEGMIVAIQVVRLQYYEFFSKFFTEVGQVFRPFRFEYKEVLS